MAADQRGPMLARIAQVKGQRLTRLAGEARSAADLAATETERASAERSAAEAQRSEARSAFNLMPGCPQARLWLDKTIAGEIGAVATLADKVARLDLARDAHGAAVRALDQHRVRSDLLAEHHRGVRRVEGRRAEDRAEADMVIRSTGRTL
ncbi:hypothetical protein [Sphingomonas xinjiangensis]|uniref:Flagellar FliJ protein n=1 Tax=Sphingomonas xinjiangensis TaxID=643568 RepID=A0A840YIZ9_9SPHN|nr:hypothetical protein [Sphingomonas xinjiangensis]MBB5710898.1 hypothetical protein [Sphingomonas xinjiangensis]